MSHGWSRLPALSFQTPASKTKKYQTPQTLASRKVPLLVCYNPLHPPLSPPSFLFPLYPSPASHLSLSFSLSPHPSPPLLRVSGRLFFLCLPLMKGRTKLPSLCPCVVGKFTSPFVSFFSFHLSVAASVLHVSLKSASRSGRLLGALHLLLCILHRTCCNFFHCHRLIKNMCMRVVLHSLYVCSG